MLYSISHLKQYHKRTEKQTDKRHIYIANDKTNNDVFYCGFVFNEAVIDAAAIIAFDIWFRVYTISIELVINKEYVFLF